MVWWKVDDKLHCNTKIRNVLADEPAALALWTVAGSWSADELTDGFIPDSQLPWLMPAGAEQLARKLCRARLWRRVSGGYQFHEWSEDGDGTRRNPTRAEVEEDRRKKAEAGRKGGLTRAENRSKSQAPALALALAGASDVLDPPTRPDQESSTNSLPPPDGFEEAWAIYPFKRGGRTAAEKAYRAALKRKDVTPAVILAGIKAYRDQCARDRTEERFVAHASTWLNKGRWDEFTEQAAAPAPRAKFAWEN
jgi:hypothetical protein